MVTPGEVVRRGGGEVLSVPPLTRRNRKGELYLRSEEVETQILHALSLDRRELQERVSRLDHEAPGYLGPECLVFLIRKFYRDSDTGMVDVLTRGLLARCSTRIRRGLDRIEDRDAKAEAQSEVIGQLFQTILDVDSDRGDFLQVRFWVVVDRLTFKARNRAFSAANQANEMLRLSQVAGEDSDEGDDDEPLQRARSESAEDTRTSPDRRILEEDAERALAAINPAHAEAFRLRYMHDMPIEDQDPDVHTISRHFNKTPRAIRNWLNAAESALQRWRERNA